MDYVKELENHLKEYMTSGKDNLQIKGWYFGINESTAIKAGVKNNEIGGTYSCPKAEEAARGKLYIIWQDNRRTVVALDSMTISRFSALIETWRKSSFEDINAPMIYREESYPKVKLFDEAVHKLVYQNQFYLFDILDRYREDLKRYGIKNVDAGVSATTYQQYVRNSLGLEISNSSTSFSTYVYGDEVYGKSFLSRRSIQGEELNHLIGSVALTVDRLQKRIPIEGGIKDVLLMPDVVEGFVGHYLVRNLMGSQVYNKRSFFSQQDFIKGKQIMSNDLNFSINTLKDFGQGSYISTYEGVAGGNINLVENGKLQIPILDLKYADLLNLQPTPYPAGGNSRLHANRAKAYEELIKKMEDGIIVYDILGLHTQDASSGNYSLKAPNCIRVKNGELKEACKAVISGNFFDDLNQSTTHLGTLPHEEQPCILMKTKVTGEK